MKKKFILLVVCLITFFTLSACRAENFKQSEMDKNIGVVYAEAVSLGYEGTLEDFLSTIKGSDGVGISEMYISGEGHLFVLFTNKRLLDLGAVRGETGAAGADGKGIEKITLNEKGELIINLSDGALVNLGAIVGKDGKDGIDGANGKDGKDGTDGADGKGIENVTLSDDGELIIYFSDDTSVNLGVIAGTDGKDGVNGADGADGRDGANGADGADGKGIENIVINEQGELIIALTDGTSLNLGCVIGKDGKDGTNGVDGVNGAEGVSGKDGLSAYELYCKYHPDFVGTEEEWVEIMFGKELSEFSVTVITDAGTYFFEVKEGNAVDFSKVSSEKEGYDLVGWTSDGEAFDEKSAVTKDMVIEAVYAKKETPVTEQDGLYAEVTLESNSKKIINISSADSYYLNGITLTAAQGIATVEIVLDGVVSTSQTYSFANNSEYFDLSLYTSSGMSYSIRITYEAESGSLQVQPA
ncbi:MAG: hypothetical protein ACI4SK_01450 [Christensenellales bacterium]